MASEAERASTSDDSLDETLAHETAHNVFLALRRLNPRYRTALILRDMHGESSASIAEVLGITPGAVDTLACRARDSFGKAYAAVSGMPPACRDAVTLAYKATGSGISDDERSRLDAHVADCATCKRETDRAADANGLAALLPLLASVKRGRRVFVEAAQALQCIPAHVAEQAPALVVPAAPHLLERLAMACATAALLVSAGAVPAHEVVTEPRHTITWHAASSEVAAESTLPAIARRVSERVRSAGVDGGAWRDRARTAAGAGSGTHYGNATTSSGNGSAAGAGGSSEGDTAGTGSPPSGSGGGQAAGPPATPSDSAANPSGPSGTGSSAAGPSDAKASAPAAGGATDYGTSPRGTNADAVETGRR